MDTGIDRLMRIVQRRVYFAALLALLWAAAIGYRLVDLQVNKYAELQGKAQRQNQRVIEVDAKRGTILDRSGRELAISRDLESCYAVPTEVPDPHGSAARLAAALGDPSMRGELIQKLASTKRFVWVRRKLLPEEVERIRALDLKGIGFVPESKRFNPKAEMASHLLGYVGLDNEGLAGLELKYDKELRGTPGKVQIEIDARNREFSTTTITPTQPGRNLVLTIDEVIQYIAEGELRDAIQRNGARDGSIVVMQPQSGEILAMANWPTYDPNDFGAASTAQRRNRAIEDGYEPGSTAKILVAAATLEEKTARIDEKFDCQYGSIQVAGHTIRDHKAFGTLSMEQIIEYSSNVGAIKLGMRLGNDRLYQYMKLFGIGSPTGIDLPGENSGILRKPKDWSLISIGALCMGQEVNVTPLQVMLAAATIANGGLRVHPRVVRQITSPGDQSWVAPATLPPVRVISPAVASNVRDILTEVVERGTGIAARMDGFSTAGKTGTAQKIDPRTGKYAPGRYVSSFVGFTPVDHPVIAMIIVIDEPAGEYYGGLVAAPVYKVCADRILQYLNVFPERRRTVTPQLLYASLSKRARMDLVAEDAGASIEEFREPAAEQPAAQLIDAVAPSPACLRSIAPGGFPDLRGKTIREAARMLHQMGVAFDASGSGYVMSQDPAPGAPAGDVSRCRLVLSLERR